MPDANYDEALVPAYTLPDPLVRPDGSQIANAAEWEQERPRLLDFFTQQVYGQAPDVPETLTATLLSEQPNALEGRAIRRQLRVILPAPNGPSCMDIALYLPAGQPTVDIFLELNFTGNHTIEADPRLLLSERWMPADMPGVVDHRATEAQRGIGANRLPLAQIIERGYGLAVIYCGDISTDLSEGYQNSIFPHFFAPGQAAPADHEWGAISAWAWGLRCAIIALTEHAPETNRIMLIGHSRLGKAALWAAAQDERAALAISNNSGCLGAALSRRAFGESVAIINMYWSRWLCKNFHAYNHREADLPIDQHTLISLIAPRPVHIASAQDDLWADPLGEFLGGRFANPVYGLYGLEGLPAEQPPLNRPVGGKIGYHIRPGEHDLTPVDWAYYLDFADRHMRT